ncbi:MAG: hypothetical protein Q4B90_05035 [Eubacteriales bacterium]|nr:hypothetical protein [Eubacteriales bacterium]
MGETAEKMIRFYERVNTGSIMILVLSLLGAFFFFIQGKLWTTVKTLRNERKGKRKKGEKKWIVYGIAVLAIWGGMTGWMDTEAAERIDQQIQMSGSVEEEEWFSGADTYKVWIRIAGKKPDKLCLFWNEGGTERTKELFDPVSEEEGYEYKIEFEAEELDTYLNVQIVTGGQITGTGQRQIRIDKRQPEDDVMVLYRGGDIFIQKKLEDAHETLYFQKQAEIVMCVRDTGAGTDSVSFEIAGNKVTGEKSGEIQINEKIYETYAICLYEPLEGNISNVLITDRADNIRLMESADPTQIVLDGKAPVCLPFLFQPSAEKEGMYFFCDSAKIQIQISESHWKKEGIPIVVNDKEYILGAESWIETEEDLYENILFLQEEGRYTIQIGPISDKSGNEMEATQSKTFIVDRTAPKARKIELEADGIFDEERWYTKTGQVKGSIVIEEAWFEPEKIQLYFLNQETGEKNWPEVNWHHTKETAAGEFYIPSMSEGTYQLIVQGTDLSGNKMIFEETQENIISSQLITVDHTRPKFSSFVTKEKKWERNGVLYFQDCVQVSFSIEENEKLKNCSIFQKREDGSWREIEIQWEKEKNKGEFQLDKTEEKTQILIQAEDMAGNRMAAEENMKDVFETEQGILSKEIIMDWTSPKVQVMYETGDGQKISLNQWNYEKERKKENIKVLFFVQEKNFDAEQWKIEITACDSQGKKQDSKIDSVRKANERCAKAMDGQKKNDGWKKGTWYETEILLEEEANYRIKIQMEDFSGNHAVFEESGEEKGELAYEAFFTIDYTAPVFQREKCVWRKADGEILRKYHYQDYAYFSDQPVNIEIPVYDGISGVETVRYHCGKEENWIWTEAKMIKETEDYAEAIISIPVDFQKEIWIQTVDKNGVISKEEKMDRILMQNMAQTECSLTVTEETGAYKEKEGVKYYAEAISVCIHAQDRTSGIKNIRCFVDGELWFEEDHTKKKERIFSVQKKGTVTKPQCQKIKVKAEMETNMGSYLVTEKTYVIDTEKPQITVEYERKAGDGNFDRAWRKAQIIISDPCLDTDSVRISIDTINGEKAEQSPWKISEKDGKKECSCTILFDREDSYTIKITGSDMAGNREERTEEPFILDKTAPRIQIEKKLPEGKNHSFYRGGGKIKISVEEEHFSPALLFLELSGSNESGENWREKWKAPWDYTDGCYVSEQTIKKEGDYILYVRCEDMAGNKSKEYGPERFTVDKTVPEITIEKLKHRSANNGKIEAEAVILDSYLDGESLEISCIGEKKGEKKLKYQIQEIQGGKKVIFSDFPHKKEEDDLYTLQIRARDLAGNLAGKKICFSVNRFGSVYTLSKETTQFLEQYYQKKGRTLEITETNVDSLKETVIFCTRDGETEQMKKGEDYKVSVTGGKQRWKQYQYKIGEHNFQQEGTYQLTLISKDDAGNHSDNQRQGEEIVFVIDRSEPEIRISGIEKNGRYREEQRTIQIEASDQTGLKQVSVFLNGIQWKKWRGEEWEKKGTIPLTIKEKDTEQKVEVYAEDLAGNQSVLVRDHFLISDDSWVQLWHNDCEWMMGGFLLFCMAAAFLILKNRQKRHCE